MRLLKIYKIHKKKMIRCDSCVAVMCYGGRRWVWKTESDVSVWFVRLLKWKHSVPVWHHCTFQVIVTDHYVILSLDFNHCRGKQTETLANHAASRLLHSAFTFLGTLQPLTLGRVDGGHLAGPAGRPADAGAVHRSDAEVVGASHTQTVHRVFAHFHRGVVALDPVVGASLAPAGHIIRIMRSSG